MSDPSNGTPNKTTIAVGILTLAIGVISLLAALGVLPHGGTPSDPTPPWIGWLIGGVFGGAGIELIALVF